MKGVTMVAALLALTALVADPAALGRTFGTVLSAFLGAAGFR